MCMTSKVQIDLISLSAGFFCIVINIFLSLNHHNKCSMFLASVNDRFIAKHQNFTQTVKTGVCNPMYYMISMVKSGSCKIFL